MPNNNLNKFFLSIVAPSILAIILFVISFFAIIIPQFEQSMMDRKKEMIRELTNSAWSILNEQNLKVVNGKIPLDSAKNLAAHQIELMRYGANRKDYYWIIDYTPKMVMHPYRKELNGTNLAFFTDSHEKKLFVDAANLVLEKNEGFIDYYWQWKDDTSKIVPKLSYVKGFEQWQWIIGTGIYLDDVRKEIAHLKNRLFLVSSIIVAIIILALIYIIRQSLNIENKRKAAEQKLLLSKQKYKTLVEASTEGTLMLINGKIVFNNLKFAQLVNRDSKEVTGKPFNDFFSIDWQTLLKLFSDPNKTVTTETELRLNGKEKKEVIISISRIEHSNQEAFILVTKDLSRRIQLEKSANKLSNELQSSLQLMNQPIKSFVHDFITCSMNTPITKAVEQMVNKNKKVLFVKQDDIIIGVVNDADLKKRVIASQIKTDSSIAQIMSSPVHFINENSLLYEAVLLFKRKRVSHLLVNNNQNQVIGTISNQDALEMQRNSVSYLIQEIECSHQIDELKQIYHRVPVLVNAILANSDNAQNTTRIITSVADAITVRVIELAIENNNTPPCKFAFMAMGSEGRMEQTLTTDQDNAIVFEDTSNNNEHQLYFLNLAAIINKNLNTIGYNYCKGEVMAMNKKWCQPISEWKKHFSNWIQSPDPQNILDSSIFFDFRHIFGEHQLIDELLNHVNHETHENGLFFYHMTHSIVQFKVPAIGDTIDLKKAILPLIGFMRTQALFHKLNTTNTLDRLTLLFEQAQVKKERHKELLQIYNFIMQVRIKNQALALLNNESPENSINSNSLSAIERSNLKNALAEIHQLQLQLSLQFKGIV